MQLRLCHCTAEVYDLHVYVFYSVEAASVAAAVGGGGIKDVWSNLCAGASALNFTEIFMIFSRHIFSWSGAALAKFQSNCSRFRKMPAILNKKITFTLFSKSVLVIPMKLGRDIAWNKRHLVWEYERKRP